jgi:hypothetical protein
MPGPRDINILTEPAGNNLWTDGWAFPVYN